MKTRIFFVDKNVDELNSCPQVKQAAAYLQRGELVAFPTETVYGLGANAMSTAAVENIFVAKGRPSDNPLIVHIATTEQLHDIACDIPPVAYTLIEHFWPGPLTLVLPKKDAVSPRVTAGLNTVAVRMPNHPIALALIQASGLPIAAPSANRSGRPSPTTAKHVLDDLDGRIAAVVDGGATGVGVESTVIDCTSAIPTILRPGGVTKEEIERVIGAVDIDRALVEKEAVPKSPGMKYTHYAPKAPLVVVYGSPSFLQQVVNEKRASGFTVGVLTTEERRDTYEADVVIACGRRSDLRTVAKQLYDALRAFDETHVHFIYSEAFPNEGIGVAIMNRLLKAAGYQQMMEK
ncbi:L-threonylcarbamoyladenylate synthase [Anoxybacillus sp. FSL W8-0382]|uniref:L-threonylcarbamoyladenylate synthase n=1 Tax=Anoxybacillus TaxID=150247 RepID=UPI000A8359B7|nr:L-threonylcarbamoyladenylate synthase [Anoxybacillus flavithermus]MBE2904458.1 threonylcarbamoyl-AMP synthase [Anoxybacillus flavithermus]MBE2910554.1 threonylcarbamoyl-AMP synthase [Anoxybacillus flavithermus]MBE2914037.1 threonylcarbamoyl-AMP synthase [Anoxybacillus flavithermus]MBE2915483.1 threonylcarbamoyl-AMP synthase [Anoxybacillus flavithermus]MBE2940546.1 threonylcarbamoyl-AMP synthase [Anoxybacillus flavithermus]